MPDQRIGVDTTAVTSPVAGDVMLLVNGASTNRHITPENLKAWIGAAAPGAVTATLTGDGSTLTHPAISHNLGTTQLDVLLLEADGQPLTYGNEYSYTATTSTITVTIDRWGDGVGDSPLADGVTVSVFVKAAAETPFNPLGGISYTLDAAGNGAASVLPASPPASSTAWVRNAVGQLDEFYVFARLFDGSYAWAQTDSPAGALYLNALRPSATAAGNFGAALAVTAGTEPKVIIGTADAALTITYTAAADGQPVQVFVKHDGTDRALTIAGADVRAGATVATVTAGGCVVEFTDLGDGTIVATTTDLGVIT